MSIDRRQRSERFTSLQQRKRFKFNRSEENINDLQCSSLLPSASDKKITKESSWTGWKPLSNDSSPQTNKENNEFPPLSGGNLFDSCYTPEPIENWADYMENEELEKSQTSTLHKKQRFKRKLLLSDKSDDKSNVKPKECKPILTDEHRLNQRQKQIDFGKNTAAYGRYITEKPRHCRDVKDPKTPDKFQICSTRSWTGQIRCWRRKLHDWDPPKQQMNIFQLVSRSNGQEEDVNSDMRSSISSSQSEDFFKNFNLDECFLQEMCS